MGEDASLPRLRYLSELPHDLGTVDPGFFQANGSLAVDATLQADLQAKITANPSLRRMGIALVELTGGATRYAGHRSTVPAGATATRAPRRASASSGGTPLRVDFVSTGESRATLGQIDRTHSSARIDRLGSKASGSSARGSLAKFFPTPAIAERSFCRS